jgi:hypothetical protein
VFPNPASDYIDVTFPADAEDNYSFIIANSLGETVASGNFESALEKSIKMDLKALSSGVYYLVISNSDLNKVSTKKIVKL